MSNQDPTPRRRREPGQRNSNLYRRYDGRFEVGYRDSTGKQRWSHAFETITAARAERDSILAAKGRGERVQPNPRLRFGEAAEQWLAEQVSELRPATRAVYAGAVRVHLEPRWGARRLDSLTVDDAARLVRELRAEGKAEWTISGVLKAASRVFTFAARRLAWHGQNPMPLLENGERPKVSATARRRIFEGEELAQTLAAAREPWRTLFAVAAVTGGRLSELLALRWEDLDLADPNAASLTIEAQVNVKGERSELKTEESRRTIELPRQLAAMLLRHRAASPYSTGPALAFCSRTGRALGQRNVTRALRVAMRAAVDADGRPTFPILRDGSQVAHGELPTFHAFRHTAASQAIRDGEGAEEVSWMLGHRNSNVTRAVYLHEIRDVERVAERRLRMEARYGSALEALDRSSGQQAASAGSAEVVDMQGKRQKAQ